MQARTFIFFLALIGLTNSQNTVGGACKEKSIFDDLRDEENSYLYTDKTLAYHDVASCASLSTGDDDSFCCYIKIKFRNKDADKKYTHKGCIVVYPYTDDSDIEKTIDTYEAKLERDNQKIDKVDIDIDCSSKYLKLAGLILLSFLL